MIIVRVWIDADELRAEGTPGNRNNCKQAKNNLLDGMLAGLCERRCLPRRKIPLSTSSINRLIPLLSSGELHLSSSLFRSLILMHWSDEWSSMRFCIDTINTRTRRLWSEFAQMPQIIISRPLRGSALLLLRRRRLSPLCVLIKTSLKLNSSSSIKGSPSCIRFKFHYIQILLMRPNVFTLWDCEKYDFKIQNLIELTPIWSVDN